MNFMKTNSIPRVCLQIFIKIFVQDKMLVYLSILEYHVQNSFSNYSRKMIVRQQILIRILHRDLLKQKI